MKRPIYCEKCYDEIEYCSELVVVFRFLKICAYHDKCYADEMKGLNGMVTSNTSLNSLTANVIVGMYFFLCIFFAIISRRWIGVPIAFILPCIRMYSWLAIERHLKA
ncbi:hypothetical protein CEB3_c20070 [Peptococcaceae bacterium CEB3]|nr:hypothetical protein CEB3_c20070 [Peptococcaceae bacterium CEB3]